MSPTYSHFQSVSMLLPEEDAGAEAFAAGAALDVAFLVAIFFLLF
jgi:hypothetical protein